MVSESWAQGPNSRMLAPRIRPGLSAQQLRQRPSQLPLQPPSRGPSPSPASGSAWHSSPRQSCAPRVGLQPLARSGGGSSGSGGGRLRAAQPAAMAPLHRRGHPAGGRSSGRSRCPDGRSRRHRRRSPRQAAFLATSCAAWAAMHQQPLAGATWALTLAKGRHQQRHPQTAGLRHAKPRRDQRQQPA